MAFLFYCVTYHHSTYYNPVCAVAPHSSSTCACRPPSWLAVQGGGGAASHRSFCFHLRFFNAFSLRAICCPTCCSCSVLIAQSALAALRPAIHIDRWSIINSTGVSGTTWSSLGSHILRDVPLRHSCQYHVFFLPTTTSLKFQVTMSHVVNICQPGFWICALSDLITFLVSDYVLLPDISPVTPHCFAPMY